MELEKNITEEKALITEIIGGAVLILTGLIPFVGPICFVIVNLTGIGLALRTVIALRKERH